MKKAAILGSVILITAFTFKREKNFIPPGTVQINDTLYADMTEISNISWLEFELAMKSKYGSASAEHLASLPDTLVWREKLAFCEPYIEYYYRHPAYRNYPVVGISYEQANVYCKWRTERVHAFIEVKEGKRKIEDINGPYTGELKFEYRLPSKQEWEALAIVGFDAKLKEKQLKKSPYLYNTISTKGIKDQGYDNADVTAPVVSYIPNKLGIYNLIGNVSEMINEKGIAKGSSWRTHDENMSVFNDEKYNGPSSSLGFRCVCVMK